MTCEDVRRALIERPSGPQPDLREHLEGCAECRALMEEIRMGDEALGTWIATFERAGSFDAAWKRANAVPARAPSYGRTWALAAAALLVAGGAFGAGWGASRIAGWSAIGTSEGHQGPSTSIAVAALEPGQEGETAVEIRLPEPEPEPVAAVPTTTIEPGPEGTFAVAPAPVPTPGPNGSPEPSATPVSAAFEASTAGVEPRPVLDESCTDLRGLEPAAMLGKLRSGQIACLEERYAAEGGATRDHVSRILMANAYGAPNPVEWERLVVRHLDEVSMDDPDLAYKYALFLSKQGGRSEEVIRWTNVALMQPDKWKADTFTRRVFALHKLRTAAAHDLWMQAAGAAEAAPSAKADAAVVDAKSRTRVFAQEWYWFAEDRGQDKAMAATLCTAAGGTCAD